MAPLLTIQGVFLGRLVLMEPNEEMGLIYINQGRKGNPQERERGRDKERQEYTKHKMESSKTTSSTWKVMSLSSLFRSIQVHGFGN
jgi:hypothetical protein